MPINATPEYFKAESKFLSAKSKEEKIAAMEEMIRLCPKHKGAENTLAQLRGKLAKLKKEAMTVKKTGKKIGVAKEGEAQVCLLGLTNSGKSWLISELTSAKPLISSHPYTTVKPEIGMMDYRGVKVQLVEIPSTFNPEFMSTVRSTDAIAIIVQNDDERVKVEQILRDNFVRKRYIIVNSKTEGINEIKEKIWTMLDLMVVYTKGERSISPMALPIGSNIKDFASRIHKDFIRNFRFARIERKGRLIQAGLDYRLQDGDIVKLYLI